MTRFLSLISWHWPSGHTTNRQSSIWKRWQDPSHGTTLFPCTCLFAMCLYLRSPSCRCWVKGATWAGTFPRLNCRLMLPRIQFSIILITWAPLRVNIDFTRENLSPDAIVHVTVAWLYIRPSTQPCVVLITGLMHCDPTGQWPSR